MCLDTSSYAVGKWAQCSKHWYNCNWLWWLSGFTSNGEDGFPHLNSYARGKIGYFWGRKSIYLSIFNLFMYILQWSIIWMTAFLNKNKNKAGLFLWGYWVFLQKEVFREGGWEVEMGAFVLIFDSPCSSDLDVELLLLWEIGWPWESITAVLGGVEGLFAIYLNMGLAIRHIYIYISHLKFSWTVITAWFLKEEINWTFSGFKIKKTFQWTNEIFWNIRNIVNIFFPFVASLP